MHRITIYHYPECSKSGKTLEILRNQGLNPVVVDYIKTPLDMKQLKKLRSYFELKDFVRTNETVFKASNLSLNDETQILQAMLKEPILMQRPVVTYKNKAIMGRPPENVLELLNG